MRDQTGRIRCDQDGLSLLRAGDVANIVGLTVHGESDVKLVGGRSQLLGLPGGSGEALDLVSLTDGMPCPTVVR